MKLIRNNSMPTDVSENFRRIENFLLDSQLLGGEFKHFEFNVTNASYPFRAILAHTLGFIPKDVILTNYSGYAPTFKYELFTSTSITVDVIGACAFRCFLGAYDKGRLA